MTDTAEKATGAGTLSLLGDSILQGVPNDLSGVRYWLEKALASEPRFAMTCVSYALRILSVCTQPAAQSGMDEKWLREALLDMPQPDYTGWDDYRENIIGLCKTATRRSQPPAVNASAEVVEQVARAILAVEGVTCFDRVGDIYSEKDYDKLTSEDKFACREQAKAAIAALQQPAQPPERVKKELDYLEILEDQCWDLRCVSDDDDVLWHVIGHWMAKPHERIIGVGQRPCDAITDALRPRNANGELLEEGYTP